MKLSREHVPFTMVANAVLTRDDISLKAKGLFAYLFSKPDAWDFAAQRISDECIEERKAVQRVLAELETAGLLKRNKLPSGRMEYRITFSESEQPKGAVSMFDVGMKAIDDVTSRLAKKIDGAGIELMGGSVNKVIDLFQPLNPSHDRLFRNKAQREAMERLISKHGEAKVRTMIAEAVKCFGKPYCPTITTPVELESKLGQLSAAVRRAKAPARTSDTPTRIFNVGGRAVKQEFVPGAGWR